MKMGKFNFIDRFYCLLPLSYIGILSKQLTVKNLEFRSALDVGGGPGRTFRRIRQLVPIPYAVGLDIFRPYILQAKEQKVYDDHVLAKASCLPFKDSSFDVVVALQVIEHMHKEEALIAIKQMERIAKKKVILSTPRGVYPQEAYDGNPYQVHESTWDIGEIESLGYRVILCGTRFIKYTGTSLNKFLSYIVSLVCLVLLPRKSAGGLICIKDLYQEQE